jgi:hypothetical protein
VEQQLARKSVKVLNGRKSIPIQVLSIMSEHIISPTNYGWSILAPSELGTTLLSCTKAHWEGCGILPCYPPTSRQSSYTLPDDAEMFMNGVLIDVYSQKWRAYVSDLFGFPPPIEQAQQTIKDTIDAVIHENNPPPSGKRVLLGCRIFPADKDPASEHDISEQGQHTRTASTSYAESDIWHRLLPSCKGCYPYSSIYE